MEDPNLTPKPQNVINLTVLPFLKMFDSKKRKKLKMILINNTLYITCCSSGCCIGRNGSISSYKSSPIRQRVYGDKAN